MSEWKAPYCGHTEPASGCVACWKQRFRSGEALGEGDLLRALHAFDQALNGAADMLGRMSANHVQDCARMATEHAQTLANLSAVQARCSELINERRGSRLFMSRWLEPIEAIVGAAWAAICKHGDFSPRLDGIPDGTGDVAWVALAEQVKALVTAHEKDRTLTWAGLLLEEVLEVLAEKDPAKIRVELAQAGAVGLAWLAAIDQRKEAADAR